MTYHDATLEAVGATQSLSISWSGTEARALFGILPALEGKADATVRQADWGAFEAVVTGVRACEVLRDAFSLDRLPDRTNPVRLGRGPEALRERVLDEAEWAPGHVDVADVCGFIDPDGKYRIYCSEL